jgi:two-component system, LytTR family, sensor kinase
MTPEEARIKRMTEGPAPPSDYGDEDTVSDSEKLSGAGVSPTRPPIMHPAIFIPAFTLLGILFSLQQSLNMHRAGYSSEFFVELGTWGTQYFLWGVFWWIAWRHAGRFIQELSLRQILTVVIPASLGICLVEQMIWVLLVPYVPKKHGPTGYWHHVALTFREDFAESMAIFWFSFFLIRGIGYYQQLREKQSAAERLETELANAKISALRMQLNPHFLFNTMNSISSLMRIDIDAADSMLEQLSSLLRMTLERGDVQLVPLHEEIEFIETYLFMQDQRYAGRVRRTMIIHAELHDALVPAMILQPIVENAFTHGISKLDRDGELAIEAFEEGQRLIIRITNSGTGLRSDQGKNGAARGVGITNVKNRLQLHYGVNCAFSMHEIDSRRVQVTISLPLQIATSSLENLTRYGVG